MNLKFVTEALTSLAPTAKWGVVEENGISTIMWQDTEITKPSDAAIEAEATRLETEFNNNQYQRLRAPKYPPLQDYIDGVVKGDQEQIQAYIDACLAVKAAYPKP